MSGNTVRLQAINNVEGYTPPAVSFVPGEEPGSIFGSNVFTKAEMQGPAAQVDLQVRCRHHRQGEKLDPSIADAVAAAMKDWALEKGATHYARTSSTR